MFRTALFDGMTGGVCLLAATLLLASAAPDGIPPPSPSPLGEAPPEHRSISAPTPAETPTRPERARKGLVVPSVLSYDMAARLDERRHLVDARATVRWINASSQPARELWIHLYLNAFADQRTLFMRSPASSRRMATSLGAPGGITVSRFAVREFGGRDLWRDAAPNSPGDPADATDIRVPLPEPVAPGASLTLDLAWIARLPTLVERTGYAGDFFAVAQWFPKIARREPDGTWSHFAFHPLSEFSADFGDYTVTLDVPARFALAAAGHETSTQTREGRRVVRTEARGVHDFAWVAWGDCVSTRIRVADVGVNVLSPRGNRRELEQTLTTVKQGLPFFEQRYGVYPYPTLHVVVPPDTASAAGGMEYPTLIMTGAPWYAPIVATRSVQSVTAHELAHQWFYGLVANDEHAWPFLDEGLASYAESELMQHHYGAGSGLSLPWLAVSAVATTRAMAVEYGHTEPIAQPATAFDSLQHLGALAYWRTSTLLRTLGNVYGKPRLEQALGIYARAERGKHPQPADLIRAIRQNLGTAAASNLEQALFHRGQVDYSVERIEAKASPTTGAKPSNGVRSRVVVRRRGTLTFPVTIALTTRGGSRSVMRWDGVGTSHTIQLTLPEPVVSAVVDPDHSVLLDDDLRNNAVDTRRRFPWRSIERSVSLTELILLGLGP